LLRLVLVLIVPHARKEEQISPPWTPVAYIPWATVVLVLHLRNVQRSGDDAEVSNYMMAIECTPIIRSFLSVYRGPPLLQAYPWPPSIGQDEWVGSFVPKNFVFVFAGFVERRCAFHASFHV
jgi:hypothetical protein